MKSLRLSASIDPKLALFLGDRRWASRGVSQRSLWPLASPAVTVTASASSRPDVTSTCATAHPIVPTVEAHLADVPLSSPEDIEERIERVIYRCRFLTIFGVVGSLMGSFLCFLKGCWYVMNSFGEYYLGSGKVILMVIEAIDVYLLGTVMLVFGMGLYELFISNLAAAKTSSYKSSLLGLFKIMERPQWLEIQSVNELKTKLGHVIVMILLVGMFEKSKKVIISTPTDLLCFAASILISSGCLYLLSRLHSSKEDKHA